jgi:hypothetical protein
MAVLGLTRLRRHLMGRQAAFGTAVAGTRAYPFSGVPVPDLNWTERGGDFGARIIVAAPYRGIPNLTANLTDDGLNYNDLTAQLSAVLGGAVTPSGAGTAQTWDFLPDYMTSGTPDVYTYERGSDTDGTGGNPNDWFQYRDGILTSLVIDSPDDGRGILSSTMNWLFGFARYAGDSDDSLTSVPSITDVPDTNPTPMFLKDAKVYVNTDPSDIGGYQLTDSVHKFTLTITNEIDQKRYVNGSQAFDLDDYGMGMTTIEASMVYAKTADTVGSGSESDAWFSELAVDRYLQVAFESVAEAEAGIPYSWMFSMPMRYYTREDGAIGGNETVTLLGRAFLEPTVLEYAFSTELVNTLASGDL